MRHLSMINDTKTRIQEWMQ